MSRMRLPCTLFHLLSLPAFLLSVTLHPLTASAAEHRWIQTPTREQAQSGVVVLPPVVITGTSIYWGSGYFDSPFTASSASSTMYTGGSTRGELVANGRDRAITWSNVCTNPAISRSARQTTSTSDTTNRWLAAQELFNSLTAKGLWGMYLSAYGGLAVVINGTRRPAYKVIYADGASEVWVVNPNHATSSVKLYDTPAPNSLTAPVPAVACNNG